MTASKRILPLVMSLLAAMAAWAGSACAGTAVPPPSAAAVVQASRSEKATLVGEIIDPQCYFTHGSRGPAHAACATTCAKGGQGLSFLDDATGVVYPLIANGHGKSQNDGLLSYLGKPVQVRGVITRKGANAVMLIQSVSAAPAKSH